MLLKFKKLDFKKNIDNQKKSLQFIEKCFEQPLAAHCFSCDFNDPDVHKTFPQILQKYVFLSSKGT